ncbi:MAG: RagB/SusD family nutrient uptake outer membrane protein [Odoribacteraceae bacterium]|jgi:hypothetical protein|nr:RagB/SusD family nutrient uptake outer membrane protein [Odoribacteraceae bacterium]
MKIIHHTLAAAMLALVACNDWLDVTPLGQIDEDKMFAEERGFQETLAGSYSQLTDVAAYGRELTVGFPDEIARYWNERSDFYNFKYGETPAVARLLATWNKMYETIANLNLLIDHAKGREQTLPRHNLIVGEAKGLRAYLHLDLLRLFGPVLPDGMDSPSIPYRDEFSNNIARRETARAIIAKIEADLLEARRLLREDPIHQYGRLNTTIVDNSRESKAYAYLYRGCRLNYHAVTATLARLNLLVGKKAEALVLANEVINSGAFRLGSADPLDFMFQPELVWGLHHATIADHLGANFITSYTIDDAFRAFVYAGGNGLPDDARLNHWFGQTATTPAVNFLAKYNRVMQGTVDVTRWRPVIPMIRLTELYYIAAEALLDTDLPAARQLLQTVRDARGLTAAQLPAALTREEMLQQIILEQLKENWGEGKMFYTYKRLSHPIIIRQSAIPTTSATFVLPIPREEIEYGNN